MATGIVVRPDPGAANAVDDAIGQASDAFHRGVRQVWLGQRFDVDALTLAAVIATAVPGLGVGTAVVPINPRHPLLVASAAQTAQAAAHGNFSLGVLHFYDQFPSYQKIIAREGVTSAADLAVIGDPDAVIGRLLRYRAAGATDVVLSPFQTQPSTLRGLWAADRRAPVVIFYNGFDVTKEILYGIIGDEFADRGIACLVIDTPGTGEPLRLRGVASRPDYEVPTSAIVDYLQTRDDLDPTRIGLLGISLGGYYAPRGAAYEHRIQACAAWGGVYDYGAVWRHRWKTTPMSACAKSEGQSPAVSVPFWQLPWVMGTDTMERALNRVKQWALADALPHLTQPLLIVHGDHDQAIPVQDARRAHAAAGSGDKQLRIFTQAEGGSEHVNADDPDPARQLIADWFADRLTTIPARTC